MKANIGTTTAQKCVRTNDIDNIGDARHLVCLPLPSSPEFAFGAPFS